jgi:hypothetical protein
MARGPVGHIYFISRCKKLVKGILVKKFPQASTDLRRKSKLTVTVCASSSPAAEHVFGVPALALVQCLSLFQQKDALNTKIGQSKGRKNTGRAGTNDDHFVIHCFSPGHRIIGVVAKSPKSFRWVSPEKNFRCLISQVVLRNKTQLYRIKLNPTYEYSRISH